MSQDFLVTSSTSSQNVTAGQTSGVSNLRVQPVGAAFVGAVTLACPAGMPSQAQCIFNPSTPVTPGTSAVDVVMNISTAAKKAGLQSRPSRSSILFALWLLLPGIVIGWHGAGARSAKRIRYRLSSIAVLPFLLLCLLSCGGVSSGGGSSPPGGGQPTTYHITVTGTSPGTMPDAGQSAQVILIVD
ncbi:MAG: hypothetical protein WA830_04920 [Candidatus Sulfotelmatobacter sp.]